MNDQVSTPAGSSNGDRLSARDESDVRENFPVVGIGASAGGLQAIEAFLTALPDDPGLAVVVIMHLSSDHKSGLPDILGRCTSMVVHQVTEPTVVEPNHIYVISPNQLLELDTNVLRPVTRADESLPPTAIDRFLATLARSRGEKAAAVVLSGTGNDGTAGIKKVKESGGLTMVQSPDEAGYTGMPSSALSTAIVDVVDSASELARRLVDYYRSENGTVSTEEGLTSSDRQVLSEIFVRLQEVTEINFSQYKESTVLRRLSRRMQVRQVDTLSAYRTLIQDDVQEVRNLLRDLLISVTYFFREPEAFETLKETVIREILNEERSGRPVRVWVPACATGQEAYSIAMLLKEEADKLSVAPEIQLFATDVDENAIATARKGVYAGSVIAELSQERTEHFFLSEDGDSYRVHPNLREMVVFARHDLLSDPPFPHLDLISCRNLLIYLKRETQQKVLELLHFALRPGKYLFLGHSESSVSERNLFIAHDKKHGIFRASEERGHQMAYDTHFFRLQPSTAEYSSPSVSSSSSGPSLGERHREILLAEFSAPSIVVNERYEMLHVSGPVDEFLQYKSGTPSLNLLDAVSSDLRAPLRSALFRVFDDGEPTEEYRSRVMIDGESVIVMLTARPFPGEESYAQVILQSMGTVDEMEVEAGEGGGEEEAMIETLTEELEQARNQLQVMTEQYETTNEELRASNEELLAMNEELQSTNEELETSKEELESMNEELKTVNDELQRRIQAHKAANSDLQNLISSTDIGTIFLDTDLNIRRYTPRATDLFNLRPSDEDRPIDEITHTLEIDDLTVDAQRVLDTRKMFERQLSTRDDKCYLMRIHPYETVDGDLGGVVMTFMDFTELTRAREKVEELNKELEDRVKTKVEELRESEQRFETMVEEIKDYAILMVDPRGTICSWNEGARLIYGYNDDDIIGESLALLFSANKDTSETPPGLLEQAQFEGRAQFDGWTYCADGSKVWTDVTVTCLRSAGDEPTEFAVIIHDLSERKRAEKKLRRSNERFSKAFKAAPVPFAIMKAEEGTFLDVNEEFVDLLGYSREQLLGHSVKEVDLFANSADGCSVLHPDEEEREYADREVRLFTKGGEERICVAASQAIVIGSEPCRLVMLYDITDRRRLEREVLEISDREQRRIGQDLHDGLGQLMTASHLVSDSLVRQLSDRDSELAEKASDISDLLRQANEFVHNITRRMTAMDIENPSLEKLLRNLMEDTERYRDISCEIRVEGSIPPMEDSTVTNLYRIAQEAVNNIIKHAEASAITTRLIGRTSSLRMEIQDDGKGLPDKQDLAQTKGLGLRTMEYRTELLGGDFTIEAPTEGGTVISVEVEFSRDEVSESNAST
jgi:two-component system CheB/CheR fusion protein